MITLAIDTSHHVAVGTACDGQPGPHVVVADVRAHVEALMPGIQQVCRELGISLAEVDEFVVGMGPGPYTGLRVGIATATTLAHVAGKPLHRVCSLDAIALGCDDAQTFLVASDARRNELFWARYADGVRVGEPQVGDPRSLPREATHGDLPPTARDLVTFAGELRLQPSLLAARHAELAEAGEAPYYLRAADASVPGAPKPALPRLRVPR